MNSMKILAYELRRLLFKKVYLLLLAVTGLLAYHTLSTRTVMGIGGSAPFSMLSYADFLIVINPFLLVILLFLCSNVYSLHEASVRTITMAAPISKPRYLLLKSLSIVIAYLLPVFVVTGVSVVFYYQLFGGEVIDLSLWLPMAAVLAPCSVFIFGLAMFLGRKNGKFILALIPVVFIAGTTGVLQFPVTIDLFSNSLIAKLVMDVHDGMGDTFDLPGLWVVGRIGFTAIGLALFGRAVYK